jgi:hypothetical protein
MSAVTAFYDDVMTQWGSATLGSEVRPAQPWPAWIASDKSAHRLMFGEVRHLGSANVPDLSLFLAEQHFTLEVRFPVTDKEDVYELWSGYSDTFASFFANSFTLPTYPGSGPLWQIDSVRPIKVMPCAMEGNQGVMIGHGSFIYRYL